MKILYLHQYFRTPEEGGALRSYYLSHALVEAGHTVELITSWNGETGKTEHINGVTVHYLPVPYRNDFGFAARSMAFLKFVWKSTALAFKLKDIDQCFATSTPLTIGIPALLLRKLRGIPYFFEVRDLWPEAPVQLGFIRNPLVKTLLFWFEKLVYRNAENIIALSPGMVAGIRQYQLQTPVYLIPNMADCDFYQPIHNPVPGEFLILYAGTIGKANRLEFLLQLAQVCQDKKLSQVKFLVAGSGAESEKIKQQARELQLNNVSFIGSLPKEKIRELMEKAAATYTSFDVFPVLETNSPNKFFDGLAAGKLCIVNTKGWLKDLTETHQCGFYADPLQPQAFAARILPFLENPALLRQYQQNARKLAETEFSRKKLAQKFIGLF